MALFSETLTSTKFCNDSLSYIGNGFCDPWINYAECQFDGGDCCLNGDLDWCIPQIEKPEMTTPGLYPCKYFLFLFLILVFCK